jgi:hypothetical protein
MLELCLSALHAELASCHPCPQPDQGVTIVGAAVHALNIPDHMITASASASACFEIGLVGHSRLNQKNCDQAGTLSVKVWRGRKSYSLL